MTHVLTRLVPLFLGLYLLLNTGMMALGSSQPPHAALAGFSEGCTDKPQPCWYGIVPGVTSENDLLDRMAFAGKAKYTFDDLASSHLIYFTLPDTAPACIFTFRIKQDVVIRADVALCRNSTLRLGDIALLSATSSQALSLPPNDVLYDTMSINVDGWPVPDSRVTSINLLPHTDRLQQYAWHGFMPLWRYCQLEPEYFDCKQ